MSQAARISAAVVACAGLGCHPAIEQPMIPDDPVPVSLDIMPLPGPLTSLGETVTLVVAVRDQYGHAVANPSATWTGSNDSALTVSADGRVRARANGTSIVVARLDALDDSVTVVVEQRVGFVRITPASASLELPGDTITLTGEPVDRLGNPMVEPVPVTWSATGAVTSTPTGLVTAAAFGTGSAIATAGGTSTGAPIEVFGDRYFLSTGTRLRYALDLPAGAGPFPAIVFVHGSGQVTRNGQRDVTDPFVPYGVAVLRYDKRGVGESEGVYQNPSVATSTALFGVLADDAANAARFLARLPRIDAARIGLIGNSQAGWIVPMAALKAPDAVRYVMLWSGPTVSIGLEIFYSLLAENTTTSLDDVYAQLPAFTGPHGYDPLSHIAALDVPGMWQYGELDRSIPMRLDVQRLAALTAQGKPFETVTWAFGDHALRDVRTNQFVDVWAEYVRFLRDRGILPP